MRVMVVWCPDWSVVAALEEAERSLALPRRRAVAPTSSRSATAPPAPRAYAAGSAAATRRRGAPSWCCCRPTPTATPGPSSRSSRWSRTCAPGWLPCGPGCSPSGRPAAGTAARPHAAATACQALVEAGVWDVRVGIADDLFTAEQAARRGRGAGVDGRPAGRLRGVPARPARRTCCRTTAPRGRELVGLLQRLGLRTLGDLADLPGDAVEHRLGRLRRRGPATGPGRGPDAVRRAHPAARARRRGAPSSRRSTPSRRSPSASAPPPSGSSPSWRTTSSSPPACGSRPSPTASSCSSRTWLHPRHFGARDLVDRVHWQLQCGTSGRRLAARPQGRRRGARADRPGPVRARGRRAGGRARRGAVGGGVRRPRRARGGPGAGHGRLRRRTPAGAAGRSQPRRRGRRWCRGASARSTCARSTGRGRAGCPGPAPVRVFAAPPAAEVRRRRRPRRCASPTAAW